MEEETNTMWNEMAGCSEGVEKVVIGESGVKGQSSKQILVVEG